MDDPQQPILEDIADELYRLLPDAFAVARDDEVRKARTAGQTDLARELNRLRRPTQSAWLVNLLSRNERDTIDQLLRLGGDLRQAQERASVADLHWLTARRRELETAVMRRAHALAEQAGVHVTATMERDVLETLAAALARPEVAAEVRTGRLVKPASYVGFGPFVVEPEQPKAREAESQATAGRSRPKQGYDRQTRAAAQEDQAARRVQEVRSDLEAATRTLAERTEAADAAEQRHQQVRKRLEQLREQVRDLQAEAAAAEQAAHATARSRDEAEKAYAAARQTLERSEQHRTG